VWLKKNRILLGSVFLLEVRLKFIGLALVHWFYLQTPHGLFVIIREPPHTASSIEKRFERINSVIITLCVRIRVFSLVLSYLFWYTYTMAEEKNIKVVFYKTPSGNEPVRAWLKSLSSDEKKNIGEDIKAVEMAWPVGLPLVRKMDSDLWEVRTNLHTKISRVFFTVWKGFMVLLHGIIKKSQKTPHDDLELAKKRRNDVLRGGYDEEK